MAKVVGGSLKLKTKGTGNGVVKKSSSSTASVSKPDISAHSSTHPSTTGNPPVKLITQKTPAQLAFEAAQLKKQQEKLPVLAAKSHKEKVAEFNEYLGKLSEHHDIPKVGPG